MGHRRWMLDQAFDPAQAFGQCKDLAALEEALRFRKPGSKIDGNHAR